MTQGKGGGPKTAAGKARSSRNAVRHGIITPRPAIIEELETVEEWEQFHDEIVQSLDAVGRLEQELAERVASLLWRLRRVTRYETGIVNYNVHKTAADQLLVEMYGAKDKQNVEDADPQYVALLQENRVIPRHDALDTITRYESHLHRTLLQTLHELEVLQARRRGEKTNLARIDVTTTPRGTASTQPKVDIPDFLQRDT